MNEEKKPVMKILDASAVLAWLREESGASLVSDMLQEGAMTAANLAELLSKLVDLGFSEKDRRAILEALNMDVLPVDAEMAWAAASLRASSKHLGLSLGDRMCLAAGIIHHSPVVTAEHAWCKLDLPIEVIMVR